MNLNPSLAGTVAGSGAMGGLTGAAGPMPSPQSIYQSLGQPTLELSARSAPSGLDQLESSIARIESSSKPGQFNFGVVGPQTKSGDRAYGYSQVMGANVGPWTERWFGKRLTPQEYLNNPDAQRAVTRGQLGEYITKYGPDEAAGAWFAGPGGRNNMAASDVLGTTVAKYRQMASGGIGSDHVASQPDATKQPNSSIPPSLASLLGGGSDDGASDLFKALAGSKSATPSLPKFQPMNATKSPSLTDFIAAYMKSRMV